MVKKCCVYGCKTNYQSKKKSVIPPTTSTAETNTNFPTVFRFPTDKDEQQRWIDVIGKINKDLIVNNETVVCENHWQTGYETVRKKGKCRPKYPPSIFEGIPYRIIPNPPSKVRQTERTSNHERNTIPDELSQFNQYDKTDIFDIARQLT